MLTFKEFILESTKAERRLKNYSERFKSKSLVDAAANAAKTLFLKGSLPVPLKKVDIPAGLSDYDKKNPEETTIHHSELTATQPYVFKPKVESMIKQSSEELGPITVVRTKDKRNVVVDGHHRLTAHIMKGTTDIPALVYNEK